MVNQRTAVDRVEETIKDRNWLSPGLASKLLDINEATLRYWADGGLILTYRTPGGHRRFSKEDILALMENTLHHSQTAHTSPEATGAAVLPRIRRRLSARHEEAEWLARLDPTALERMRGVGREVLSLCIESLTPHRVGAAMATAKSLGSQYGEEAAQQGVPLPDTVQAFTFFRGAMLEALRPVLLRHSRSTHELNRCWHQLNRLTDGVLLSMTQAYAKSRNPAGPGPA